MIFTAKFTHINNCAMIKALQNLLKLTITIIWVKNIAKKHCPNT